jgi:putative endonuclease
MFYTYIIYSKSKAKYYIGYTHNLEKRLTRHNSGWSSSTKAGIPWKLVYFEEFDTKSKALKREYELKRMKSRKYIEELINNK